MKPAFVLLLCLSSGCALVVSKGDYADYRQVRLSRDDGARLLAMQRYVERHPDGHYYDEVQAARAARELATFRDGKGTRVGLDKYLAAYPDGTFAAQAHARLSAIDLVEQQAALQKQRELQVQAERDLRQADLRRTWVTRFVRYWGKTLLGLSSWGASIPDVAHSNPVFSRAFGAEPRPRCTLDECVKYYDSAYAVPVPGGTRIERSLSLLLRLRMREGKLERAELLLPGHGFSRWFELEQRTLVVDPDPEARNAAVTWAMNVLAPLVAELGEGVTSEAAYVLAPIERPAIASSGGLIDTAAEDPAAPPNRLTAADGGEGSAKKPDVAELVKPDDRPNPDMVFAPMRIDESGRAHKPVAPLPAPEELVPASAPAVSSADPAPDPSTPMVMTPMVIARPGSAPGAQPSPAADAGAGPVSTQAPDAPEAAVVELPPADAVVKSVAWRDLRVVFFAAAGVDGGPAYDGIVIERRAPAVPRKPAATVTVPPSPRPRDRH